MTRPIRTTRTLIILTLGILVAVIATSFRAEVTSAQWSDQAAVTSGEFSVASNRAVPPAPTSFQCQDSKTASVKFEWQQKAKDPLMLEYALQIQRDTGGTWVDEGSVHTVPATKGQDVSKIINLPHPLVGGDYRATLTANVLGDPTLKSNVVVYKFIYDYGNRVWDC